jgi:hypothetical protein
MSEPTTIKVNPLSSGTIFKKGFSDVDIFTRLVLDFTGAKINIEEVENEKAFVEPVANIATKFDLFAEDKQNRIIVEAQHANYWDNFDRFFFYHQIAMAETIASSEDYRFPKTVYTLVFFTDRLSPLEGKNILVHDAQMRDIMDDEVAKEVFLRKHRLFFIFTKAPEADTRIPEKCQEWIKAIHETLKGEVCQTEYSNLQIKRLFERIAADKTTPEDRAKMKFERTQNNAIKEAVHKDRLKTAREFIKLEIGISNLEISSATGLSLPEIEALRKNLTEI